jgi:hypothetical protein
MVRNGDLGEMLIGAPEEAVEHHEGRLSARVDRVEITARYAAERMLAARDRIRRYFSPDVVAGIDPDEAEVVGGSAPTTQEFRGGR